MRDCPGPICWGDWPPLSVSYWQTSAALSLLLGLPGLLAVLAGAVVLLRRRGYRRLRAQYDAPHALDEATAGVEPGPDDPAPHNDAA